MRLLSELLPEVKVSRNAVPVKELLPVWRSPKNFKYANVYLFFCFCSIHIFYMSLTKHSTENECAASENKSNTVWPVATGGIRGQCLLFPEILF